MPQIPTVSGYERVQVVKKEEISNLFWKEFNQLMLQSDALQAYHRKKVGRF